MRAIQVLPFSRPRTSRFKELSRLEHELAANSWEVTECHIPNRLPTCALLANVVVRRAICPGDVNRDGRFDGRDIDGFIDCIFGVRANCPCADMDGSLNTTINDVPPFVVQLLMPPVCR